MHECDTCHLPTGLKCDGCDLYYCADCLVMHICKGDIF